MSFESPSPAFLAGAQHGAKLALQHSTPTSTSTNTASPRKPASSQTSTGAVTLNQILAQARAMAAQDTNAQVAGLQQQQNTYTQQAKDRAAQINLASQAAAQYLSGIGDQTASSYTNAAKDLAGIAGGYSGDLRNTATDAASQIQAQLAGLGAPAGSLKTSTGPVGSPEALGNVLYGLGGALPANLLVTSGQAAAAAQRGLPASTLGYGQQQALGTLAAGQQQADTLTPQILTAQAGLPKLAQQYLQSIQSQMTNTALANSLIDSRTNSATIAQGNLTVSQQRLKQQQANADRNYQLALDKLNKPADHAKTNATLSKSFGYLVDGMGNPVLQDGQKVMLPKPAGAKKPLGLNPKDYEKQMALALGAARTYHSEWTDADGNKQPPLTWQQYLTAGEKAGTSIAVLYLQGRKIYTPDERKLGLRPGG